MANINALKSVIRNLVNELGGQPVTLRANTLSALQGELRTLARRNEGVRQLFMPDNTYKVFVKANVRDGMATENELQGLRNAVKGDSVAKEFYEAETIGGVLERMGFKGAKDWANGQQVLKGVQELLASGVSQKELKAIEEAMARGGSSGLWDKVGTMVGRRHAAVEKATQALAEAEKKAMRYATPTAETPGEWKAPLTSNESRKLLDKAVRRRDNLKKMADKAEAVADEQERMMRSLGYGQDNAVLMKLRARVANLRERQANAEKGVAHFEGILHALQHHESRLEKLGLTHNEARRTSQKNETLQQELKLIGGLWDAKVVMRETDNAGTPMEKGTYVLMSGKYRGKTVAHVYSVNPNYFANMTEGRFLHSELDKKAARAFEDANRDVGEFVKGYFKERGGKSGPDLERGEPGKGWIGQDAERRGRGLRDAEKTDTTTHRGEDEKDVQLGRKVRAPEYVKVYNERTGKWERVKNPDAGKWVSINDVVRKRAQTRRDKREPDYEGWESRDRAEILSQLLRGARQRGARHFERITSWERVARKSSTGERQMWWRRRDPISGQWEYRKRNPHQAQKRAMMAEYERLTLMQVAQKMSTYGEMEVKPEQVVEILMKRAKLDQAIDRKAFGLRMKPGDEISVSAGTVDGGSQESGERELVPGMDQSRHRRGVNATDRIEEMQRTGGGKGVGADARASLNWLERVEALHGEDEEGMQALRQEMHEEYHEYNLNDAATTVDGQPGGALAWHRLNERIRDAQARRG